MFRPSLAAVSIGVLLGLVATAKSFSLALLSGSPQTIVTPTETSLDTLLEQDRRVSAIAYRLTTSNREFCVHQGPQWGLTLHSASMYGPRLRETVLIRHPIGEDVGISSLVPGGPADAAGLALDDRVISINGQALVSAPRDQARHTAANYDQVEAAWAMLNAGGERAQVEILRRDHLLRLTVMPRPGCAYDALVTPSSQINASADGRHVFVTSGLVAYAQSDDDLALILGHELAHNVLHHRLQLDRSGFARGLLGNLGSSPASLNRVEREADYVGLYLTARAGFDIGGAEMFWRRALGQLGDPWYLRWSHPGDRERAANARATIDEIAALVIAGEPLVPDTSRLTHWPPR